MQSVDGDVICIYLAGPALALVSGGSSLVVVQASPVAEYGLWARGFQKLWLQSMAQ